MESMLTEKCGQHRRSTQPVHISEALAIFNDRFGLEELCELAAGDELAADGLEAKRAVLWEPNGTPRGARTIVDFDPPCDSLPTDKGWSHV